MADHTKIEWTEATWNPIVGCTVATPGCTNCYAMRAAYRMAHNPLTPQYRGTAKMVNGNPVWTGTLYLVENVLTQPLRRKKPTTYFVNSMGDLFHEDCPDDWIDRVFAVMALCPQHTFQVLTKRADRMREYFERDAEGFMPAEARIEHRAKRIARERKAPIPVGMTLVGTIPWPHVWLGVSAEDQTRADLRIPNLLATPAAKRFVSAEPLLGPVDFGVPFAGAKVNALNGAMPAVPGLDWVIVGGESGPRARPMHPDWARSLRDQCQNEDVPFFFKQWGEWLPSDQACPSQIDGSPVDSIDQWDWGDADERLALHHWDDGTSSIHLRKQQAGRFLDGRKWDETPLSAHRLREMPAGDGHHKGGDLSW